MKNRQTPNQFGFTLIELLIVVAIIAILAAIAVPNFLEAQVRAKVSRAKSDMRSLTTALEAYAIDYNAYPNACCWVAETDRLNPLTTPVAFITSIPQDIFWGDAVASALQGTWDYSDQKSVDEGMGEGTWDGPWENQPNSRWRLASNGPDRTPNWVGAGTLAAPQTSFPPTYLYDATNGTISLGDIIRFGP